MGTRRVFLAAALAATLGMSAHADIQGEYFQWTDPTGIPAYDPLTFDGNASDGTLMIHVGTVTDPNIDFDWGTGGPTINGTTYSDTFAVRWRGRLYCPDSGSYTFYCTSDDGIAIWINRIPIAGDWIPRGTGDPTNPTTGSVTLSAGYHDIQVEYFEDGGGAAAFVDWSGPAFGRQRIPANRLSLPPEHGLNGHYATNSTDPLDSPTVTRNDRIINWSWGGYPPEGGISSEQFTARWTGKIQPPGTGEFQFITRTDDGSELWVNGQQIIDRITVGQAATDNYATPITLTGGQKYAIDLRFREQTGDAFSQLRWSGPNTGGDQVVNEGYLFTEENAAPANILPDGLNINENSGSNALVAVLSVADDNAFDAPGYDWAFVGGSGSADNGFFLLQNGTELRAFTNFDYENRSSYSIRMRVTDYATGTNPEQVLTYEEAMTVTINDINESPTDITLGNNTIDENAGADAAVGGLTTSDPDNGQSFVYTLAAGTGDGDNGLFQISGGTLQASNSLDHETQETLSVRIRSTDNGSPPLATEKAFTITVNDVNEAPTDIALDSTDIGENAGSSAPVGNLSGSDPDDGQALSYALVAGAGGEDNALFDIAGGQLVALNSLDHESDAQLNVLIEATDNGTPALSYQEAFVITVNDVNEAPTDITLDSTDIDENAGSSALVGNLGGSDPDDGQTLSYALVAGAGGEDNALFDIVGGQLVALNSLDHESDAQLNVLIEATDDGTPNLSYQAAFVITVNDVNEPPVNLVLDNQSVDENQGADALVGTLSVADPDDGQSHTFEFAAGTGDTDNAAFSIVGNQLRTAQDFDFETQNSYSVRVRAVDNGTPPLDVESPFVITVNDVNESPTALTLDNTDADENQAAGALVGQFATADPDNPSGGQTFTYQFVTGTGDTGNGSFSIDGDLLRTGEEFDHETQDTYSVRVRSTDSGAPAESIEETFTITINDVNEPPADLALSQTTIPPTTGADTAIATISSDEPDDGQTSTYTFAAGTGDTDNGEFVINGDQLVTGPAFSAAGMASYAIRIRVTDDGTPPLSDEEAFIINVTEDTTPPVITLSGDATVMVSCGEGFTEPGYTAVDNVDGDITADVMPSGDTDIDPFTAPGTYQIAYNVADQAGNNATTVYRTVIVTDNCPLDVNIAGEDEVARQIGESILFQAQVSGEIGSYSIAWQVDADAKGFVVIPGANEVTYSIDMLTLEDSGAYRCEVSDAVTSVLSESVMLSVTTGLPAAGLGGLVALAAALALAGAAARRR